MNSFFQDIINTLPSEVTPNMLHSCGPDNVFLKLHNEATALKNEMAAGINTLGPAKSRDSKSLVAEELGTLAWQVRKIVSRNDRNNSSSASKPSSALASSVGHYSEALRGQNEEYHRCKFVLERLHDEISTHKVSRLSQLEFVQQDNVQCHALKSPCFEVQLHNSGKSVKVTIVVPSLAAEDGLNVAKAFSIVERELTDAYIRGRESFFIAFYSLFRYFHDLLISVGDSFPSVLKSIIAVCGGSNCPTSSSSSSSSNSMNSICGAITVNGVRVHYGGRPDGKALLGGYVVANSTRCPVVPSSSSSSSAQCSEPQFDLLFEGPPVVFTKGSFLLAVGKDAKAINEVDSFTQWQITDGSAEMYSYERLASGVAGLAKIKNTVRVDESTSFCFRTFSTHNAMTVARIPLRSLTDLPATLGLLARQVAFNKLFASCFRSYKSGKTVKETSETEAIEPPQKKAKTEEMTVVKMELVNINLSEEPFFTMTVKSGLFSVLINVAKDGVVTAEYNGASCDALAKMLNLTYNVPFSIHHYMKQTKE